MADRMAQALQQSPSRDVAQGAEEALKADKPFTPAVEEPEPEHKKGDTLEIPKPPALTAQVDTPPVGTRWVATSPGTPAAPPVAPAAVGRVIGNVPEPSQPE